MTFKKLRNDEKVSLDAHKSSITRISFSVEKGTGIYVPFNHKVGRNVDFVGTFGWIKCNILMNENLTVVIYNAAFGTMFFYALGFIPKCKVYDIFSTAQVTLKLRSRSSQICNLLPLFSVLRIFDLNSKNRRGKEEL